MKGAIETIYYCIVTKRPHPKKKKPQQQQQNLCLDKGYNYPEIEHEVVVVLPGMVDKTVY